MEFYRLVCEGYFIRNTFNCVEVETNLRVTNADLSRTRTICIVGSVSIPGFSGVVICPAFIGSIGVAEADFAGCIVTILDEVAVYDIYVNCNEFYVASKNVNVTGVVNDNFFAYG